MSGKEQTSKKDTTDAVDAAVNAALNKVREGKASGEGSTTEGEAGKTKKAKLTDEEKVAKQAQRDAERAQRKAEREAKKAAKQAEREANRKPAHLAKVTKAGEKLPQLSASAQQAVDDLTTNHTAGELAAIALHLAHFNRVAATERALSTKLVQGQRVRIVSGDPRFIGKMGTIAKAQRIRCYVSVEGFKKDHYCFTSDCEAIEEQASSTGTDG